jgi:hypothetical protein
MKMNHHVLIANDQFEDRHIERIGEMLDGWATWERVAQRESSDRLVRATIVVGWAEGRMLAASPIKYYFCGSAGFDAYLNTGLEWREDFVMTSARHAMSVPVAEHVLALMFALARLLPVHCKDQLERHWQRRWDYRELSGSTVCIVGLGGLGTELARRCAGLGMRVLGVRKLTGAFTGQRNLQSGSETRYHQTTWGANETINFISEKRATPWLLNLNWFAPHPPFAAPAEYLKRMNVAEMPLPLFGKDDVRTQCELAKADYQTTKPQAPGEYPARHMIAAYYAEIELIDDQLSRILKSLEATGQRDNTIIIFTTDHGELLGDHGLSHKGCRFYEGAVRVPLLISWPGRFKAGLRSNALVELTDIVPTLLDVIGQQVPRDLPGKSLLPMLEGKASPDHHRAYVRSEYYDALQLPNATHATMYRDDRWKLVVYHGLDAGELYDLREDPHEFRNLWNDAPSQAVKLKLIRQSFDATMLATDPGQPRVGRY